MTMTKLSSAVLLAALIGGPALAQDSASTVVFAEGDNGGALPVAQAFYGQSQPMETAILDINDDGAAEIAVKFTEGCVDGECRHAILYFSNSDWVQIFSGISDEIALTTEQKNGMRQILTSDNSRWFWTTDGFLPKIADGDSMKTAGQAGTSLLPGEERALLEKSMTEIEKREIDIDGDGASESFIYTRGGNHCTGDGYCPVLVFSSKGDQIGSFFALENDVRIKDGKVYVQEGTAHLSYSYDGEALVQDSITEFTPVIGR